VAAHGATSGGRSWHDEGAAVAVPFSPVALVSIGAIILAVAREPVGAMLQPRGRAVELHCAGPGDVVAEV
jgi:hypothetical protein